MWLIDRIYFFYKNLHEHFFDKFLSENFATQDLEFPHSVNFPRFQSTQTGISPKDEEIAKKRANSSKFSLVRM